MPQIGTLIDFVANTKIVSSDVDQNFADIRATFNNSAVLTDVARTITVTHEYTATQTFTGGLTSGGPIVQQRTGATATDIDHWIKKSASSLEALRLSGDGTGRLQGWYALTGNATPNTYMNEGAAYKTTAWMTVSGTIWNDGRTDLVMDPTPGKGMVLIWSDVDDHGLVVRDSLANQSLGERPLASFSTYGTGGATDLAVQGGGDYKFHVLNTGRLAWGNYSVGSWASGTTPMADIADTYMGRDSGGRLLLTGAPNDTAGFIAENAGNGTAALAQIMARNDTGLAAGVSLGGSLHATEANRAYMVTGANEWRVRSASGAVIFTSTAGTFLATLQGDGDLDLPQNGKGIVVTSPDGLTRRRIGIDNAGAIAVTAP